MAKATFTPAVTETKTVEVEPAKVTLKLTPLEAVVLAALVGNIRPPGVTEFTEKKVDVHALYAALQRGVAQAGLSVPFLEGSFEFTPRK